MNDRVQAFTVVLAEDLSKDDADLLAAAIGQLRGVLDVTPVAVSPGDMVARARNLDEWTRFCAFLRRMP